MAKTLTTRFGLTQWGAPTDGVARTDWNTSFANIDSLAAIDVQGLFADRPAYGVRGRYFYATDRQVTYRDTGTGWVVVGGTTENSVVRSRAAATTALTVQGETSQSADLLRLSTATGVVQASFAANGDLMAGGTYVRAGGTASAVMRDNASVSVQPLATNTPGLVVRGRASQTADLARFQDSTGTNVALIDAAGLGRFLNLRITDLSAPTQDGDIPHKKWVQDNFVSLAGGSISSPLGISGATANIDATTVGSNFQLRTSRAVARDTVALQVGASGGVQIGGMAGAQAGTNLLRLRGANAQSGNYLEVMDADGTSLASINSLGVLRGRGLYASLTAGSTQNLLDIMDTANNSLASIDYRGNLSARNFRSGNTATRTASSTTANLGVGALFWDTTLNQLFGWNGEWLPAAGRTISVQSTEPLNPKVGDLWFQV